jgi:hypothetical protein
MDPRENNSVSGAALVPGVRQRSLLTTTSVVLTCTTVGGIFVPARVLYCLSRYRQRQKKGERERHSLSGNLTCRQRQRRGWRMFAKYVFCNDGRCSKVACEFAS